MYRNFFTFAGIRLLLGLLGVIAVFASLFCNSNECVAASSSNAPEYLLPSTSSLSSSVTFQQQILIPKPVGIPLPNNPQQEAENKKESEQEKKIEKLKVYPNSNSFRLERPEKPSAPGKVTNSHHGLIINVCNLPNDQIATVSDGGQLVIWDTRSGKAKEVTKVCDKLWCIERLQNNAGFLLGGDLGEKGCIVHLDSTGKKILKTVTTKSSVISFLKESETSFWCGTSDRGLYLYDWKQGKLTKRLKYGTGVIGRVDENRVICGYSDDVYVIDTKTVDTIPVDQDEEEQNPKKKRVRRKGKGFVLYRKAASGWICRLEADPKKDVGYIADNNGGISCINLKSKFKVWKYQGSDSGISWFRFLKDKSEIIALDQTENIVRINCETGKELQKIPIKGIQYSGFTEPKDGKIWLGGLRRPIYVDLKTEKFGLATDEKANKELIANWIPGGVQRFVFKNNAPNWGVTGAQEIIKFESLKNRPFQILKDIKPNSSEFYSWTDGSTDGIIQSKKGFLHVDVSTGKVLHTVPLRANYATLLPDKSGLKLSGQQHNITYISPNKKTDESESHDSARSKRSQQSKKADPNIIRVRSRSVSSLYTYKWGEKKVNPISSKIKRSRNRRIEQIFFEGEKFYIGGPNYERYSQVFDKETFKTIRTIPLSTYNYGYGTNTRHVVDNGFLFNEKENSYAGILNREIVTLNVAPEKVKGWIDLLSSPRYQIRQEAENNLRKVSLADIKQFEKDFPTDSQTRFTLSRLIERLTTPPIFRENCYVKFQHEKEATVRKTLIDKDARFWLFLIDIDKKSYLRIVAMVDEKPRLVDELEVSGSATDCQLTENEVILLMSDGKRTKIKLLPPQDPGSIKIEP